ncbi:dihydropteroate synthase [Acaryochloris sp. CCMEE 5410]|uniref:dihydropteroate synthase n=1 Tax=Acaryochloris sp. CCMEE 5410 TaxID=310037 RepID=UPI0002484E76|nr:dihydropteroate synthase [Acaryochloris sp. CCMEE 5410]KAI9130394.1 dihydropteroate synthase [Acaryochloris sp. CCMEE 5410]
MNVPAQIPSWTLHNHTFAWGSRTYLMGILNVTPDSFSDGGQFNSQSAALSQAHHLVKAGIDILDIGGQSTRPQAIEIAEAEELDRVIPVIQAIRSQLDVPISVDTTRSSVAAAAIAAGADLVNDVSGGIYDPQMLSTVAHLQVPIILMHMRGTPQTMQKLTDYQDLVKDIIDFLQQQIDAAQAAGILREFLAIDPGIGFAKTGPQNLSLLREIAQFRALGCPILVGPSRKSFIGQILNQPDPQQRVWGTAAACCAAIQGGADILRIHDGAAMREVCQVADAIWRPL